MDSLTHLYFAHKLLLMTNSDPSAAVSSLFPQIDRVPAYFHRMYGHPLFNVRSLAPIGVEVYRTGQVPEQHQDQYAWKRFFEERTRMKGFETQFAAEMDMPVKEFNPDPLSVLIGYVSHVYQDTFNNPIQAFLPHSVYPCGQWALWQQLDAIEFRLALYDPPNIAAFRREFFSGPLWERKLEPKALLLAMIQRTGAAAAVPLNADIVKEAYRSLNIGAECFCDAYQEAANFLASHEELLGRLIKKYSCPQRPAQDAGAPVPS